ncbi:unnamed protein product [Sympodiomycopsis kandeliae]
MHQAHIEDFQPGCQGISGTFVKPTITFKESADHYFLASQLAAPHGVTSPLPNEDAAGGYFSFRPRRNAGSSTPGPSSFSSSKQNEIMTDLAADVVIMGKKGAARWRKVATTMPKSLWKPDTDALSCDHLSTINGACEKPFGRFIGKYKLPNFSAWSPSLASASGSESSAAASMDTEGSTSSSTSSLWGSIKTNRRNNCWRCGNCFCDDHSSYTATLILDREDAMQYFPPMEDEETEEAATEQPVDLAEGSHSEPAIQAPAPMRSATMMLTQYLAASPRSQGSGVSSNAQQRNQRLAASSAASHGSSAGSDDWRSITDVRSPSAMSARFPSPGPQSRGPTSIQASANCSPKSASSSVFPLTVNSSKPRRDSGSSSILALSALASRAPTPMTPSMTQLPDGRIAVRERVCLRCHDIVEHAKGRAVQKQAIRKRDMEEFAAAIESLGGFIALDPSSDDFVADDEEEYGAVNRLFDDYRKEQKKNSTNNHSEAHSRRGSLPRQYQAPMLRQHSAPYLPSRVNSPVVIDDVDEEDDSSSCSGHGHVYSRKASFNNAFPSRACSAERKNHQPSHNLPHLGMGGQRLQRALAPYQ